MSKVHFLTGWSNKVSLFYDGGMAKYSYICTFGTQMTPFLIGVRAFFWRVFSSETGGHSPVPGQSKSHPVRIQHLGSWTLIFSTMGFTT